MLQCFSRCHIMSCATLPHTNTHTLCSVIFRSLILMSIMVCVGGASLGCLLGTSREVPAFGRREPCILPCTEADIHCILSRTRCKQRTECILHVHAVVADPPDTIYVWNCETLNGWVSDGGCSIQEVCVCFVRQIHELNPLLGSGLRMVCWCQVTS